MMDPLDREILRRVAALTDECGHATAYKVLQIGEFLHGTWKWPCLPPDPEPPKSVQVGVHLRQLNALGLVERIALVSKRTGRSIGHGYVVTAAGRATLNTAEAPRA